MNGRNFYSFLVIWLVGISLSTYSLAQTITTGSFSPVSLCSGTGGTVTIPFTITGTFSTSNTFSAELSDATGTFATTPPVIGTLKSAVAGSVSATIPAATSAGTYKIRVVSDNPVKVGSTSAATLTISAATPPAVTTPPPYCQNDAASALVATASAGGTLNWYSMSATGGTASTTATVPNTSQAGVFTYYVSQTINGCESSRVPITVTIKPLPVAPSVASISLCNNGSSAPLTANGQNLKWYDANNNFLSGGAPTPGTGTVGDQTYKVSQTVNSCEGPKAILTVTVTPKPSAPGVSNLTYCLSTQDQPAQNIPVLTASGQGLKWYNADGSLLASAPTPSVNSVGVQSYSVSQTVSGCESSKAVIQVTVRTTGLPTVTNTRPTYCAQIQAQPLEATAEAGASLRWINASGVLSTTAPTPSTNLAGDQNFSVYQIGQNGCYSERAFIRVTINPTPSLPSVSSHTVCQSNTSVNLSTLASASTGGILNWYGTLQTGGTASAIAPDAPLSVTGSTTYYVSQSVNSCEGSRAGITITVNSLPAAPGVSNLTYCLATQDQPAQNVGPLNATGTALKWYNADGSSLASAPTPSVTSTGAQSYQVSQTINTCESTKATIQVTVQSTAVPTIANAKPAYCQQEQAQPLAATAEAGASLRWVNTSGVVSTTAPTPPTNTAGDQSYAVYQIGQNTCYSSRVPITVTIKPLPGTPAVVDIGFCNNGASAVLTANGQNLKWYDASDNFLSGGAPTPGTGTVGDQTYKVSQTVNSCEGPKATLTVTIKPLPAAPLVANLNFCLPTTDQPVQNVTPLTANGQNLRWFNTDGNQFPTAPTPVITQTGTQTFQVDQTVNGCTGGKATLQVTIATTARPTVAKKLITYCINDKSVPLEATAGTGGSLRWVDPYNNVTNLAPTPYTLNTSIKPDGDPFYVYQVGQNGCYSQRDTIKVLVNALPTLSLIPATTNVNLGQRVPLQLKFTSSAPYSYTLTGGYAGVVNRTDTTISLLPRATTTYQVISVKNSCGVGLPGNPATATITVRVPTVTTSSLTSSTLCAGTSLSVPFTTTGEFNQGNLFRVELVSTADTSKKYAIAATAGSSPVTAPLPLTLVGGQYYVRVKADNPEIAITGSNSPTILTVRPQPSATLTGNQNIYVGYPANLTLTLGGDSPWTVVYADTVRSYSATVTASPYLAEVRPTRTTTYQLVSVSNGCGSGPVSGSATVTVMPLLAVDDPLDPLVKTYPVPATSVLTIELDLPLTRDPAVLSLTDMSGRRVMSQTIRNKKYELDVTSQPNGLYLLHIQVGDRQTVRKILKQ